MPAHIRITLRSSVGGPVVGVVTTDQSRDDPRKGYEVECYSVDVATTYSWALAFTPKSSGPALGGGDPFAGTSSGAVWLPPAGSTGRTAKFVVDWEGSYLVRLVVDAGLPTESSMFVRLRRLTQFADIKLVAAGERRDQNGVIPVDASAEGWANDQNQNLQRLIALVRRLSSGERRLYVDVNRGRNNAANQNDPTNIVNFPGPDAVDLYRTGINLKAEGFGDFYSITDAIAYAAAAATRGEPAPSVTNPYIIIVRPGLYVENLVFQPNIHVVSEQFVAGATGGELRSVDVTVRTTSAAGARHEYTGAAGSTFILAGITLENLGASAQPVLWMDGVGGIIQLYQSVVLQKGTSLTQGPAVYITRADADLSFSVLESLAMADVNRYALIVDASVSVTGESVTISGAAGIQANENLDANCDITLNLSTITAEVGRAFRGYPSQLLMMNSTLSYTGGGVPTVPVVTIDNFGGGVGAAAHDVTVFLQDTAIHGGDLSFDTTGTTGDTELDISSILLPDGDLLLPTGTPTLGLNARTLGRSLAYIDQWVRPEVGGAPTVPVLNRLGVADVQDAIDWLVNLTLPIAGVPHYGLTSVYNGLASINPLVYGQGLGRVMLADDGAMQVTGAASPMYLETDGLLRGGIQAEGIVDIGPLKNDGLGTEITLNPNTQGGGPMIRLGRDAWADNLGASDPRALPAGLILATVHEALSVGASERPYNLLLRTMNLFESGTGELGRVVVEGGSSRAVDFVTPVTSDAGDTFVQGGDVLSMVPGSAGQAGNVWLVPGSCHNNSGNDGRVRIANQGAKTFPVLTAANLYDPLDATEGTFYMASINGIESFAVGAADTLNDVVNTINTTARSFFAQNLGGFLSFGGGTSGINADFFYMGDDQGGALNTKLGELRVPIMGGATYVPGTLPEYVDLECTDHGELTIHGGINVDGGAVGYHQHTGGGLYTVGLDVGVVGVDTSAPVGAIILPVAARAGTVVRVKDETHNANVNLIAVHAEAGTILEGGPLVIAVPGGFLTVYYSGEPARGWFNIT